MPFTAQAAAVSPPFAKGFRSAHREALTLVRFGRGRVDGKRLYQRNSGRRSGRLTGPTIAASQPATDGCAIADHALA